MRRPRDGLQGVGQLGEQQREGDDPADDDEGTDDPPTGRDGEDVAVADRGRRDDEVPPVGARIGDLAVGGFDQRHDQPAGGEDQRGDGQRQPPAVQPQAGEPREALDQEVHRGSRWVGRSGHRSRRSPRARSVSPVSRVAGSARQRSTSGSTSVSACAAANPAAGRASAVERHPPASAEARHPAGRGPPRDLGRRLARQRLLVQRHPRR